MEEYLNGLNPAQLEAATAKDGYILTIAGAGAGKTHTLVARVAYLLDHGVDGKNLLLVTFTNKAAQEMKYRIGKFVGEKAEGVTAKTFHSFAYQFLKMNAALVDYPNNFQVMTEADASMVIKGIRESVFEEIKKRTEYDKERYEKFPTGEELRAIYGNSVNHCVSVNYAVSKYFEKFDIAAGMRREFCEIAKGIIEAYNEAKRKKNRMDYDDLMEYMAFILTTHEGLRKKMDERYQYIMCDEYQDTNAVQEKILGLLSKNYQNLMVVGDDNQSIYKFRGAEIRNILTFSERYPNVKKIYLTENYRSTQEILNLSNTIMHHAKEGIPKDLHGQKNGKLPELVTLGNEFAVADKVVDEIVSAQREGKPLKEIAVMSRSSLTTAHVEQTLSERGIPFKKFGGLKFYEREVVLYLTAMLRLLVDVTDELAWDRVLKIIYGIGDKTCDRIFDECKQFGYEGLISKKFEKKTYYENLNKLYDVFSNWKEKETLSDIIKYFVNQWYVPAKKEQINTGRLSLQSRQKEINRFKDDIVLAAMLWDMSKKYENIQKFIDDLLLDNTVSTTDKEDYVNITTIHSAKGLEYDTVFLLNCLNDVFPRCRWNDPNDPEELRCLYVALTRAKNRLVILNSEYINTYEGVQETKLSRHLDYPDVKKCLKIHGEQNSEWYYDYSEYLPKRRF